MATLIPKVKFPNVPNVPGVPQILRRFPSGPGTVVSLGTAIKRLIDALTASPTWGIFTMTGNVQAIKPDSVLDFDYRNEYRTSNFPVQDGLFATYNKVATPFETGVRLVKSGTKADRAKFIQQLDALLASLALFKVVTPEKTYLNCNMMRYEVSRKGASGAYLLAEVDLFFTQVLATEAQYTSTAITTKDAKEASARPPVNLGTLQPKAVVAKVQERVRLEVSSPVGRIING